MMGFDRSGSDSATSLLQSLGCVSWEPRMNTKQLEYFLVLCRTRNISAASSVSDDPIMITQ